MRNSTWGFAGVAVTGKFVDGVAQINRIRGMEGFEYLEDIYNKDPHTIVDIICSTENGGEALVQSECISYLRLVDGIPDISFLSPCRIEPFDLYGWGTSKRDNEFVVDHYKFRGDTFCNQEIANSLAYNHHVFDIYDKDGNCIHASDIRTIDFPHKEWVSDIRSCMFPPHLITTKNQFVITYDGKKWNIVNNN